MAEMMIAIVILGLGMLMAATMFPIGWMRARDLADFTNSTATTSAAATTVQLLCRVSDGSATTSFLGDGDPNAAPTEPDLDLLVHVLHMENMLFESDDRIGEALFEITDLTAPPLLGDFIGVDPTMADEWIFKNVKPPVAQVAIHERVFPSMSAHPPDGSPAKAIDQWESQLLRRRFAWSVLHRLEKIPDKADQPRSMVVYLVTLRRTQSTHRFARQEPAPNPSAPLAYVAPRALPGNEDVLFPVPWLVTLTVKGSWLDDGTYQPPVGIPSEAVANPDSGEDGRLIAQMLTTGSVLIDQHEGHVYTVQQHRFTGNVGAGSYDFRAEVTLDREITEVDLGLEAGESLSGGEDIREFWVFPPPVARGGGGDDDGFPVFDGQQPVVSIETRQMVFSP